MKNVIASTLAIGFFLWLGTEVWAGGAGVAIRLGSPRAAAQPGWRARSFFAPGYRYGYPNPYPYGYYGYYPPPVIIAPYYYPYAPVTVAVSAPFFCFTHHVGYVSRAGMLDHLSGTHKLPLETASDLCPESEHSCLIDGY